MSAIMMVSLTPEETEDGAGNTDVFSYSNELFITDCLLECLGFISAGCSLMSALLGKPSSVVTSLI